MFYVNGEKGNDIIAQVTERRAHGNDKFVLLFVLASWRLGGKNEIREVK